MNKKLGLAVAGALLAASASANAGITIPAGDWTVDIRGNDNAFYTRTTGAANANSNTIGTGLLPAQLGIGAKTRQNDLDIAFQFSFFTGTSQATCTDTNLGAGNNSLNIRQAYLTFGDASWGTIKLGRDLGIFGSDAILSDMTLLGVGTGTPSGNSTLGHIGTGYMYANWYGQVAYISPNWNGFQVTAGVTEPINDLANNAMSYMAKATYDFAANDVTGRVWVIGIYNNNSTSATNTNSVNETKGFDIGGKVGYAGAELVGYYYDGDNLQGSAATSGILGRGGRSHESRDSGGYVQATFKVPGIGTKLGASWGENNSTEQSVEWTKEGWTVGAYHPLTKSLNLVAEYNNTKETNVGWASHAEAETKTVSLGAIMFF